MVGGYVREIWPKQNVYISHTEMDSVHTIVTPSFQMQV